MSLRFLAAFIFVAFFSFRAWKDWFPSLCAAILLMAVVEHPDMPKSIAGIPGLNLWNVLIANVTLAWWRERQAAGRKWELPPAVHRHTLAFLAVVFVSFLRLLISPGIVGKEDGAIYIVTEHFINCFKWLIPAVIIVDGCRTRQRIHIVLAVVATMYALLAIQVIRWIPPGYALSSGMDMARRASKITENEIGYNRVTLSMVLGGASWVVLSSLALVSGWKKRVFVLCVAATIILGQALTGGRTGYASWVLVGLTLGILRWRKILLVIPILGIAAISFLPGVRDRLFFGVGGQQGNVVIAHDDYEMTSGRTLIWPYVIEKIKESPIAGYGRRAMINTGLRDYLMDTYSEGFPHPHNAYLEMLLDNGLIGFLITVPLFFRFLVHALSLFRMNDPTCVAIGGGTAAIILALLLGSMGGQTFYPRESSVGMWALIGLMYSTRMGWRTWDAAPAEPAPAITRSL